MNDPGLLRVRQAARTLIAVAISLACFHNFGGLLSLFAAFSSAAFMQANSGRTRRQRRAVMLVTGFATALLVFAGGLCHGHRLASELFLLVAAFLCFFARHWVPDRNLFTLYSFVLAVLANTYAGGWPHPLRVALAVFSGLPIAFVVYFFIWRPRFARRFAAGVRDFLMRVGECAQAASTALRHTGGKRSLAKAVARARESMEALMTAANSLKGSATGDSAEAVGRLMRRIVVTLELIEEDVAAAGERASAEIADAVATMAAAFEHVQTAFAATRFEDALEPEPLRERVVSAFQRAPNYSANAPAGAALAEAAVLAAHLEDLGAQISRAILTAAFHEDP